MIKQYKEYAEASRKRGGRAPNVTRYYFPKQEVLKTLEKSRNYSDACFRLGLMMSHNTTSARAYANLKMIADWYGIDLDYYLIKGGELAKIKAPGKMTKGEFERRVLVMGEKRIQGNYVKKYLFKFNIKECICEQCGFSGLWYNKALTLELHHVNGNPRDNRIDNLQILCPNCHSQTPTHRGRNLQKT
jgi:hypothetical protein